MLKLDSVSVYFFKVMSILKEILVWTLVQGRFDFPITLSLFDVFKLSDFIMLMCKLIVVNIQLLDLDKTFLTYSLLDNVKSIFISVSIVDQYLDIFEINLKIDKTFKAMSIEH